MKYEKLRDGLIDILNSMGYVIKLYNKDGGSTSNPYQARYIFVENPNMMFIIDNGQNLVEMHRSNFNFNTFKKLIGMIRKITKKYFIRLSISTYNQTITPKTFSRDVLRRKTNFSVKMLESKQITHSPVITPLLLSEMISNNENSRVEISINNVKLDNHLITASIAEVLVESYTQGLLSESSLNNMLQVLTVDNGNTEANIILKYLYKQII